MSIKELSLAVFLLNLPFGYMRSRAEVFSARWMLAVHLPVPFVFLLRRFSGASWHVIPLPAPAALPGQVLGGKIGGASRINGGSGTRYYENSVLRKSGV